MKILITGGAGFIGSHVLEHLQKYYPQEKIFVLDNLSSGNRAYVPASVELIEEDIRSKAVRSIFAHYNFDAVIHLAAQTMVPYSITHPAEDADINVAGLINVLEASKDTKVKSVVFSSSAAVYGDNTNLPLQETEKLKPTSFYGITKMATEHYLRIYHDLFGINATVLRFANVYGERQGMTGEGGVISIFVKKIAKGEPLEIFGSGEQTRDFIYVKDIACALCLAVRHQGFGIFNVSTQQEVSINTLINILEKLAACQAIIKHLPPRNGDIFRSVLANSALKEKLKMQDFTSLDKGLANTYHYFLTKK